MKTETSVVMEKYKDSVFSAAFSICANAADAEDVVQDTFIRYHTTDTPFADEQHIRAWLLRVAINKAKNVTMSFWRRKACRWRTMRNRWCSRRRRRRRSLKRS